MSRILTIVAAICILFVPARAGAASSFVYVVTPVCASPSGCHPEVLVYDAGTSSLATRIPLADNRRAAGMAISPDGSRVYVNLDTGAAGEIAVVDATRHQVIATHPARVSSSMAVSRDGSRLFMAGGAEVAAFDTTSFAVVFTITSPGFVSGIAASPTADRVYVMQTSFPASTITEYDSTTGAPASSAPPPTGANWLDIHVSRDGTRVYATSTLGFSPSSPGTVSIFDPATWTLLGSYVAGIQPHETVDSVPRQRSYTLTKADVRVHAFDFSNVTIIDLPSPSSIAIAGDDTRAWIATSEAAPAGVNGLHVMDLASNAIVKSIALEGTPSDLVATPPGANACRYRLDTKQSSWSVNGGTAPIRLVTPCTWVASSDAPWARLSAAEGSDGTTLTLTVDQNFTTTNRSATLSIGGQLVNVTQASFSATPAFGFIDTPADFTTGVTGALAVSGWALDDVGVARVRIFRDPVAGENSAAQVFIGDATFVDGARPDVAAFLPSFPNASRAGWGYQLLTNFLPGNGNGTFRLWAYAEDVDGHTTVLGSRVITCANATAARPFGSLDTPRQGAVVSGTIVNFGWALTPQPASIPTDGSTIFVVIDGVVVGQPTYGFARGDIQALFPGYANTDSAVGFFILDTTTLANGVHSIAWIVRDSTGATQGIGSRFFTVDNP